MFFRALLSLGIFSVQVHWVIAGHPVLRNTLKVLVAVHCIFAIPTSLRGSLAQILLEEIGAKAGLVEITTHGDIKSKRFILETTGNGVAVVDYDNDGLEDIFLVNGSLLQGFPPGKEPVHHLYRNNGDGTFTDTAARAGVARAGWGQGVAAGDFDNDGNTDLIVSNHGKNLLFRNNGDGTFTEVGEKAGIATEVRRWSTGCAFLDYDRDGWLDLFIANYVHYEDAAAVPPGTNEYCLWKGMPVMCGPRGLRGSPNQLLRNNGNGTFTDVTEKAGITRTQGKYSFGVAIADFDDDGWPDIYVACDMAPNILYRNNRDGTFTDVGVISGSAYNERGYAQAGMGVAAGDYDRDGDFDLVTTNFSDDTPTLYRNDRGWSFSDESAHAGLTRYRQYLGWGIVLVDLLNSGWLDLVMANGHVYPQVDDFPLSTSYRQRRLVFQNQRNGKFEDVTGEAGIAMNERHAARGLAAGDLDNDGRLDLVLNNMNEKPSLLRNVSEGSGHWLKVRTVGTKSNRDGIGAKVSVLVGKLVLVDEVRSGGSYLSQSSLRLHFGLGPARRADDLTVRWPSGLVEDFKAIQADRCVLLKEGSGVAQVVTLKTWPPSGR